MGESRFPARMIRARISPLKAGLVVVDESTAHYLGRVLRLKTGDRFIAFCDVARSEAIAELVRADEKSGALELTLAVANVAPAKVLARIPITVVQGLAKGDKCDQIVRDATELGATRIVFADTERTIVRLKGERAEERQKRWQRIAEEAARQCGRADPPHVGGPLSWEAAIRQMDGARFCLWENAKAPLRDPLLEALRVREPISFAVGPEGGLSEAETLLAENGGCRVVSLGPFVLRTETVATAVLGAIRIFASEPEG